MKEQFDGMDINGNGMLDRDELRVALRALGQGEGAVEALLAGHTCCYGRHC